MTKPILCLDFDGVIHSYTSGWKGADVIPDPPVPGAMLFIARAVNHFRVAIFSSRSNQSGGLVAMQNYMHRELCAAHQGDGHDIYDLLEWPTEKPAAFVSIDDRAITFTGVWPDMQTLLAFKPWNKK
jgi:hypothetical protein